MFCVFAGLIRKPCSAVERPQPALEETSIWTRAESLVDTELKGLREKLFQDVFKSKADGTSVKYYNSFCQWKTFASDKKFCILPASVLDFALYLTHLAETRGNLSCITSAVYGVNWAHDLADLKSPTGSKFIVNLLSAYKRRFAKKVSRKEPINSGILVQVASEHRNSDDLLVVRDITMALLLYAGFLRFSEVQNLLCSDIAIFESHAQLILRKSKTDQYREGNKIIVSRTGSVACPVKWLERYICLSGITLDSSDYLFRQIGFRKGKKWLVGDKSVSYSAARSSILGRLELPVQEFGLHSFRSGGATAAITSGVSLRQVKLHGRWKSDAVFAYIKSSSKDRQEVSRKLGI